MDSHLQVAGDVAPSPPCMFVGFHYGTGYWSLRYLRRLGHRVSFVSAPVESADVAGEPLRLAFLRWRQRRVEAASGAPVIYVGGSSDRIRNALRDGVSILALIDVPEATTSTVAVPLLGHHVQFPDGILRIAAVERVPLVGYVASLDAETGRRELRFTRLPDDPAQAMRALAAMLDAAIREDSASWHFWSQWPRFAVRAPATPAADANAAVR
jgi:lauroyl/myristoyl acyltransferase